MITWQDPVALVLAALLFTAALGWRRVLIKRGEGPACARCDGGAEGARPTEAKPTRIDVASLRMSRRARPPR